MEKRNLQKQVDRASELLRTYAEKMKRGMLSNEEKQKVMATLFRTYKRFERFERAGKEVEEETEE